MKRWTVTLAGCLVMLGPGALCAYSLLVQPMIASFGWNTVTGVLPFALASCFFGVGAVLGGLGLEQEDPRRITVAGIGLWALGATISGLTPGGFGSVWFFFGYGVLGGIGSGAAAVSALTVLMRWFPEKRGLGAGLATMGFGLGGFAYTLVLAYWPRYAAAAHMNRRELGETMTETMIVSGIVFFILGACALLLEDPPEDDPRFIPSGVQTPPLEMFRHPQFPIQWTMLFLNATGGVAIIANAAPIIAELTGQTGSILADRYLLPMLASAVGSLFWGVLSDRIGHRFVFGMLLGLQSVVFFALGSIHDPLGVCAALALVFFCYGGGFGAMPGFHVSFFGTERFSVNYGIMLSAWGCAGIIAPLFYATIKDLTGSYAAAFQPIGLVLLVAVVFPIIAEQATPRHTPPEESPPRPARQLTAPRR